MKKLLGSTAVNARAEHDEWRYFPLSWRHAEALTRVEQLTALGFVLQELFWHQIVRANGTQLMPKLVKLLRWPAGCVQNNPSLGSLQ